MEAPGRIWKPTLDCNDIASAAQFWKWLLGVEIILEVDTRHDGQGPTGLHLGPPEGPAVMSLQRVDDAKLTKNRMHLDVMTDDLGACIEQVVGRGGNLVDGPNGTEALEGAEAGAVFRWAVMADPQGNEFCLTTQVPGT